MNTESAAAAEEEEEEIKEEEDEEDDDESSEEEYKEGGSQKFITPIEVQDHIRKLWNKESQLLGLMYGRFDQSKPFETDTMGFKQFF